MDNETYFEIKAEVLAAANSPEGIAALIEGLLWKLPLDHPLVPKFRQALSNYVYAKRCLELWAKKGVERSHWTGSKSWTSSIQMEVERDNARSIEAELISELGKEEVNRLKREIGKSLYGILRKKT
jgi:hypothetical protein